MEYSYTPSPEQVISLLPGATIKVKAGHYPTPSPSVVKFYTIDRTVYRSMTGTVALKRVADFAQIGEAQFYAEEKNKE